MKKPLILGGVESAPRMPVGWCQPPSAGAWSRAAASRDVCGCLWITQGHFWHEHQRFNPFLRAPGSFITCFLQPSWIWSVSVTCSISRMWKSCGVLLVPTGTGDATYPSWTDVFFTLGDKFGAILLSSSVSYAHLHMQVLQNSFCLWWFRHD